MSDLLRVLRAVRTVGGLVGLYRHGWFRSFAVVLSCLGVGFLVAGPGPVGLLVAGALGAVVYAVRSRLRPRYSGARRLS